MLSEDESGDEPRDLTEEAEEDILSDKNGGKYLDEFTFDSKKAIKILLTVVLVMLLNIVIMLMMFLVQSPKQLMTKL
jgi:hypothetical protein